MVTGGPEEGTGSEADRRAFDALLAEFQFLRVEIAWLIANGMRYQQFAIVIIAAGLSASTVALGQYPHLQPALGFAISAFLSWLGLLYFWEHVEIHVVAGYLKNVVREKIRRVSGINTWWEWEEYKNLQWQRKEIGSPKLLKTRLWSFCAVSALFGLSALIAGWQQQQSLRDDFLLIGITSLMLALASAGLTIRLAFLITKRSDLGALLVGVRRTTS